MLKSDIKFIKKSDSSLNRKISSSSSRKDNLEKEELKYYKDMLDSLMSRGLNK